jgi:hypothetical protein
MIGTGGSRTTTTRMEATRIAIPRSLVPRIPGYRFASCKLKPPLKESEKTSAKLKKSLPEMKNDGNAKKGRLAVVLQNPDAAEDPKGVDGRSKITLN